MPVRTTLLRRTGIDSKNSLVVEKLGKLQGQALQADTERILKQSLYEEVQQGRLAQLPEAFADSKLAAIQNKLSELSIQSAQYVGRFGPDNPRTQDVRKQMAALQQQLDEGRTTLAGKLKADYERATREEQTLRAALEQARTESKSEAMQQNQAVGAIWFAATGSPNRQKSLYRISAKDESGQHSTGRATQQFAGDRTRERCPSYPWGQIVSRIILTGFLLSLCFGIGLALTIEFFDDTIKTTDDISRFIGLPALAVIPAALLAPLTW